MAVESRFGALRHAFSTNACCTRDEPRPRGLVAFDLAERRQSYVRGVAVSREPPKLQQA